MKKLLQLLTVLLFASFGAPVATAGEAFLPDSVCNFGCAKSSTCRIGVLKWGCGKACNPNKVKNCMTADVVPLKTIGSSLLKNACYYGCTSDTCKNKFVGAGCKMVCPGDKVVNCMKAYKANNTPADQASAEADAAVANPDDAAAGVVTPTAQ